MDRAPRRGAPAVARSSDLTPRWSANQDAVTASTVDNPRPAIVWDIAVHHADLHEALGLGELPERMWAPVLEAVAPMKFGAAEVPEGIDDYELFRALFSRRSRTQMQAWGLRCRPSSSTTSASSVLARTTSPYPETYLGRCSLGPRSRAPSRC